VPDIGGAEAAEVVELLVSAGDAIGIDDGLIVLESDKASMEIPSTVAGTLVELLVKEGDQLAEGDEVAVIETDGEAQDDAGGDAGEDANAETEASEEEPKSADPEPEADSESVDESAAEEQASEAAASASSENGGARETVRVPDIGGDEGAEVVELLVAVGDSVDVDDGLVVLESDKASMEVPSSVAGKVVELLVKEGDTLSEGDEVAIVETAGSADSSADKPATGDDAENPAPEKQTPEKPAPEKSAPEKSESSDNGKAAAEPSASEPGSAGGSDVYAGPAVRKLAREFGVPLERVRGTGPRGRILKEDLHTFAQKAMQGGSGSGAAVTEGAGIPPIPEVDFSAFGDIEVEKRSKLDLLTAANMQRSWLNLPHVSHFDEADITELEDFRQSLKAEAEKRDTRITPMPFIIKACAVALRAHPRFNSSLTEGGNSLAYKKYFHIGMAVDTPAGLMVPVIRDVDRKTLWELSAEILELAEKARERKLKPDEMRGGCFTVSSLGGIGGNGFTPIINAPEVGILGVSRAAVKPVWDGEAFQPRTMLPLTLSYDHRVINGGDAGRFMVTLTGLLSDIRRLVM
jgi:pyruvate dehydrogenase E2 component (dihydrolipoamide acetyltransferase)